MLRELSQELDGWVVWNPDDKAPEDTVFVPLEDTVFVPLNEWRDDVRRAHYKAI